MGRERDVEAEWNGRRSYGRAEIESTELKFRGEFRLTVPFGDVFAVSADGTRLLIDLPGGSGSFDLGDREEAERWAERVRNPPSLLHKLGVLSDMRVSVIGLLDPGFLGELRQAGADVSTKVRLASDLVFVLVEQKQDIADRLAKIEPTLRGDGAVWVLWPKGRPELRETDIIAAGPAAGLVDVKVVRFSDRLSGLKLVVPLARRAERA
jgi:hypothetical protein